MTFAQAFADIALDISAAVGGIYHDALAKWPGTATYDTGGSITTPGTPIEKTCSVQIDAVTESMRGEGYTEGDMRLLVLAATLDGDMDTDATIEMLAGPHMGQWMVSAATRDPCGVYWECRGRRADVAVGGES